MRLGPYEVAAPLGAGGMGEVYRARDTSLNRDVAIKVLPAVFANDPDRVARFKREAQLLAALNHPHIGGIYGLEESNRVWALVLELVGARRSCRGSFVEVRRIRESSRPAPARRNDQPTTRPSRTFFRR